MWLQDEGARCTFCLYTNAEQVTQNHMQPHEEHFQFFQVKPTVHTVSSVDRVVNKHVMPRHKLTY